MSTIINAINNLDIIKERRGWDRTFWAFDIHGTLIKPNYDSGKIPTETYDYALEVLKMLNNDPEVCLIMYTCSHPHEISQYVNYFKGMGINFDYVNENPEVKTDQGGYGCYDRKPYFNILFEDKAGFNPETDWAMVLGHLLDRESKRKGKEKLDRMVQHLTSVLKKRKKKVVVFTGAGISAESGIPTFRDKLSGLWETVEPELVAHIESWNKDPQMVSAFHEEVRTGFMDALPNDAHKYFADLENYHDVTIITQNIDNLHEQAGSTNVLHLHGEINKAKCEFTNEVFEVDGDKVAFGKVSVDNYLYKPYTVLFGEMPHKIDESIVALQEADILVIVGTSFDITYILPMIAENITRGIPVFYIDKKISYNLHGNLRNVTNIEKSATEGVKDLPL